MPPDVRSYFIERCPFPRDKAIEHFELRRLHIVETAEEVGTGRPLPGEKLDGVQKFD
jgi:hypothetical protein